MSGQGPLPVREEYERLAEIVAGEMLLSENAHEDIWNMALKHAARLIRREGAKAPWSP